MRLKSRLEDALDEIGQSRGAHHVTDLRAATGFRSEIGAQPAASGVTQKSIRSLACRSRAEGVVSAADGSHDESRNSRDESSRVGRKSPSVVATEQYSRPVADQRGSSSAPFAQALHAACVHL